jgi:hypothetical protein
MTPARVSFIMVRVHSVQVVGYSSSVLRTPTRHDVVKLIRQPQF